MSKKVENRPGAAGVLVIKALHRQGAPLPCGPSKFTITDRAYAISPSQSR